MTLVLIVVLALGGLGVYVAYQNPKLGGALLVGLAVVTALYLILEKDPSVFETDSPVPSMVPAQVPPGDLHEEGSPAPESLAPSAPSGSSSSPAA
ncbi:hypothetical protein ACWCQB_38115 [Streptomyces hirsutus]